MEIDDDFVWTISKKTAPFSSQQASLYQPRPGSLLSHARSGAEVRDVTQPFAAELTAVGTYKGYRSAFRVLFQDADGREFPMFAKCFTELLTNFEIGSLRYFPRINGLWSVTKQGRNYSIRLLEVLS